MDEAAEMTLEFKVLGPLEVRDASAVVPLSPKLRALLAALLSRPNVPVPAEALIDALWGEEPPRSAGDSLRIYAHRLAQALGGDMRVRRRAGGFLVAVLPGELDAAEFTELTERAAEEAADDRATAARLLRAALRGWRGTAFAGQEELPLVREEAARLNEMRQRAVEEWVDTELELGRHAAVVADLTAFVAEFPYRERLRAQLMTALHRQGRSTDALEVYREGRRLLVEELGLEPGRELREAERAVLAGEQDERAEPELPAAPAPRAEPSRPAELPLAASAFTGRRTELDALDTMLRVTDAAPLPLCVVSGPAGVGKTALALHWAHSVVGSFPDGQLYADLRGYDADAEPVEPAVLLERFLRTLGVPAERIPAEQEAREALFRSTLQGRRVLIVLDNAASSAQVRPLLPGALGCLVLVTARRRLEGLVAGEGARSITLDLLTAGDAVELLRAVAGPDRVAREADAAARLGALCDRLPLALRIAAARLATRPRWTLADLAERLAGERGRLDALSLDDLQVRGSFELSYRELTTEQRVAFRRLGMLGLPAGFAPWVVAAMLDTSLSEAERLTEALVDAQLVQPIGQDRAGQLRYGLHDLIRLFARERATEEDSAADREAALRRFYSTLLALMTHVRERDFGVTRSMVITGDEPRRLPAGVCPEILVDDALEWFDAERPTMVAAITAGAAAGRTGPCWELVAQTATLLWTRGHWDDWGRMASVVLEACRRVGDRRGEAVMLYSEGAFCLNRQRLKEGELLLVQARDMFAELGDEHGGALVQRNLATIRMLGGDVARAAEELGGARRWFAELGDAPAEAHAIGFLSHIAMLDGRLEEAERLLREGLAVNPPQVLRTEAQLRKRLAEVLHRQGRAAAAVLECERAMGLVRDMGDAIGEAHVLHALGEAQAALPDPGLGAETLRRALVKAREVANPVLEGRVLMALAEVEPALAGTHLRAAIKVLTEVGAGDWLARAQAALARCPETV